jgi:2-(1,2-epoxy-1,2-dihydrophenyl)acetyl-CoA isomerase
VPPIPELSTLTIEVDGDIGTLTLNRPDSLNAMNPELIGELTIAAGWLADEAPLRGLVVTGAGDRAFSAGGDVNWFKSGLEAPDVDLSANVRRGAEVLHQAIIDFRRIQYPVVAAVNGVAAGAGVSLALACDYRLVADTAGFNLAFAGIGLSCDTGSSWTLPRLVGRARALELLYEPRTVRADEALALGLATRVVPAAALAEETAALAQRLAAGPTQAYAAIRQAVTHAATADLATALAFEAGMMARTGATQDHRDAVEAFLAKQPPEFHGR